MPNTNPSTTAGVTEYVISAGKAVVNILPILAITTGLAGEGDRHGRLPAAAGAAFRTTAAAFRTAGS
jgi:hypothetical protein